VEDDRSTTAGAVEAVVTSDGEPRHSVIVGPSTNAAALVAALVGGSSKVPVVSWNAGATALDDRSQYPYYARTNPSQRETAKAIVDWMQLSGVTFVAVFLNDDDGYELCAELAVAGSR
jgi:ABC-type branched-subunit amino acid transport system substrate-binding protein